MPGLRPYAWVWVIRSGMSDLQVRRHVSAEWDFSCTRRVHARTLADRATSFPSLISALVLTGLRQHKDTTTTTNWSSLPPGTSYVHPFQVQLKSFGKSPAGRRSFLVNCQLCYQGSTYEVGTCLHRETDGGLILFLYYIYIECFLYLENSKYFYNL